MPSVRTGGTSGYARLLATAAGVVAVDQITKKLVLENLSAGETVEVLDGIVTLRLTFNSGGAFGILQGVPGFFLIATMIVAALILFWARNVEDSRTFIALGMVLGGGLGNVTDRLFRARGRVVDFIDLQVWPVFNLADSFIVIGVGLILLWSVRRPAPP